MGEIEVHPRWIPAWFVVRARAHPLHPPGGATVPVPVCVGNL